MPTNLIVSNFWSMKITPMWFSVLVGRKIAIFELLDSYSPTLKQPVASIAPISKLFIDHHANKSKVIMNN